MATHGDHDGSLDVPRQQAKDRVVVPDRRVGASGRVTIPDDTRARHDIDRGDYVDLVVYVESDAADSDDDAEEGDGGAES